MFTLNHAVSSAACGDGVSRKILVKDGAFTMAEVVFRAGTEGARHSHVQEQVSYIVSGSFELFLDGKVQVLKAGDSVYIPSNAVHGVKALEDNSKLIDVFTPQRDL